MQCCGATQQQHLLRPEGQGRASRSEAGKERERVLGRRKNLGESQEHGAARAENRARSEA